MGRYKVDLLMISENDSSFPGAQFFMKPYSKPYRPITNSKGGGTILKVRENAPFNLIKHHVMAMTRNISYLNLMLGYKNV